MTGSVILCVRLVREIGNYNSKVPWYVLLTLICFFLIGYIVFLYLLVTQEIDLGFMGYLLGAIFFFGAVFVITVLVLSYRLVRKLNMHTHELSDKNITLQTTTDALSAHKNELEQVKLALEKKNRDLEETLEDFYTMRLGVLKDLESGTVVEENKKIRERIDAIKKQS